MAAAYYGAARVGLLVVSVGEPLSSLWLPAGIALVALLVVGLRTWPGIALGAFFVNASQDPLPVAGAITVGDTLAPVCAFLLLRLTHFRLAMDRLRDALLLVFLGSFTAMLVSATFGTVAAVVAGRIPADAFWRTWGIWWTSDALGVLVV
ncbi:MAG TPA: MASE1 domain-containing protein, partial [Mycobacterium sp.]|nr:MASE1 domain-containing protein [Mycobacterium sp.]